MARSDTSSARPTSRPVYLERIMATMSVPPVEAPTLNTMALPMAGRATAKHSSSRVSSVKGWGMGYTFSKSDTKADRAKEE